MGIPEDMDESSTRKRRIGEDAEQKRKAKRKKVSKAGEDLAAQELEMMLAGEIPSLFQMQVDELLKETRMKKKRLEKLQETVETLKDVLLNMSPGKERKLHLQKWMKDVNLPVAQEPLTTKGCFQFRAPTRVFLGGSVPLNTCVQPGKVADLFMEMPKECLQAKDCFNHRYIRKRALYLSAVALRLSKASVVDNIKFTYHGGNHYKPILILSIPVSGKGKPLTIHLHAIPEDGVFKLSRFDITKNNVRPKWFSGEQEEDEASGNDTASSLPPTPVYSSSILQDLCYNTNAEFLSQHLQGATAVQDAIALLKVWMHQRELDVGYGCFSGFLMSMYVCHLLSQGTILRGMSSFQIMKHILVQLSKSGWLESPVVLCPEAGEGARPSMDDFMQAFDVVFVDVTGYLNLALGMTKSLYSRVCHEAGLALQCTDQVSEHLFMTPCPFNHKFDITFTMTLTKEVLRRVANKLQRAEKALDLGGFQVAMVMPGLLDLLEQGLGDRVTLIQPRPLPVPEWSITEEPPPLFKSCTLTFGLLLHESNSLRLLDRGPPANAPEAVEFREFWGEKSELRRFKDGAICEAVVWAFATGLSQKRNVCNKIITHVLKRHAAVNPEEIHPVGRQLENVLHVPQQILLATAEVDRTEQNSTSKMGSKGKDIVASYGSGEERIYQIRQTLEELGKTLRKLPNLSLRINAVTGIDPAFRFSEVFPAHPAVPRLTSEELLKKGKSPLPIYTPAMTVICNLEGSGHWPENIDAIRALKSLYLIDLGEKLTRLNFQVDVQETHVDILQDGFVFRLKLGVSREVAVLRMVHTPEGMLKMEDTPEALAIEAETTRLPEITTLLQGVQQDYPSFCVTVRLIKRWVSAQLLLGHIPDTVVEKTVVRLFNSPLPFTAPQSPCVGLLRFLKLVSSADYKVEEYCDKGTHPPAPVIMNWLRTVATQSLDVLQSQPDTEWKIVFRPPLDVFDLIIHLNPECQSRRHQGVGVKSIEKYPELPRQATASKDIQMPVTAFNPAEMFLDNLQSTYGDFALFFHDRYGGEVIAVLIKPTAKGAEKGDSKPRTKFDLDKMLEAVHEMGEGIVTKVDLIRTSSS